MTLDDDWRARATTAWNEERSHGRDYELIRDDHDDMTDAEVLLMVCLGRSAGPVNHGALMAQIYQLAGRCAEKDVLGWPCESDDIDEALQSMRELGAVMMSDDCYPRKYILTEYGRRLHLHIWAHDTMVHRMLAKGVLR